MPTRPAIRIGTRASPLAQWQAQWVAARLAERGATTELVPITTTGDQQQVQPLTQFGGIGVFTKEIQRALLHSQVDLAVHSLKDLPTAAVPGLMLAAVPPRGPTGDVLVTRDRRQLDELPAAANVATGSVRRRAQLWHVRPDLHFRDIRGNVETRLRRLLAGDFDALVLAEAGLRRLGMEQHAAIQLPLSIMLPAPGQGALGLETRVDDEATRSHLAHLDDPATRAAITAERALLAALHAGCLAPVGALGRVESDGRLHLSACVLSPNGRERIAADQTAPVLHAQELGRQLAEHLLHLGAARLIHSP